MPSLAFDMQKPQFSHTPVLMTEVLHALQPQKGECALDLTGGGGGHAQELLTRVGSEGSLHIVDRDPEAIAHLKQKFNDFSNVHIAHSDMQSFLNSFDLSIVNCALIDAGVSSHQLDSAHRGFSFQEDGPLDMRMNPQLGQSAFELLMESKEKDLADIFYEYGEERKSRQIAAAIVKSRDKVDFSRSKDFAAFILSIHKGPWQKIHPATRVFQALRIVVNAELDQLRLGIDKLLHGLSAGARLSVISFHSLEDRIVKHSFRDFAKAGKAMLPHRKPVIPGDSERNENPRSRSSKLRSIIIGGGDT